MCAACHLQLFHSPPEIFQTDLKYAKHVDKPAFPVTASQVQCFFKVAAAAGNVGFASAVT